LRGISGLEVVQGDIAWVTYKLVGHDAVVNLARLVQLGGDLEVGLNLLAHGRGGHEGEGRQIGGGADHGDDRGRG
jgi:hypothetical protein